MSDDRKILGWRVPAPTPTPIYEVERGWIATAAFVLCCQCERPIRSMGGPMLDAWCVPCFDAAATAGGRTMSRVELPPIPHERLGGQE